MAQNVQFTEFTLADFQSEAGIAKLNLFFRDLVAQAQVQQGTLGPIKPDNNIDLQGKWKVVNSA